MKALPILLPIAIATLLSACGANMEDGSTRTIVMGQSFSVPAPAGTAATHDTQLAKADSTGAPVAPVMGANMPEPECAADGCRAVRVIDSNLEVAHLAAMRRAAQEAGQPDA